MIYDYIEFNKLLNMTNSNAYIIKHPYDRSKFSIGTIDNGFLITLSTKKNVDEIIRVSRNKVGLDDVVWMSRPIANKLFLQFEHKLLEENQR